MEFVMQVYFKHFLANEAAGVSLEYALLIGLIGLTVIPGSQLLSSRFHNSLIQSPLLSIELGIPVRALYLSASSPQTTQLH